MVIGAGAIVTALLLSFALTSTGSPSANAELTAITQADLDQAAGSLDPKDATAMIAEAKSCKAPLAILTISKSAGAPDSTIRVSSGSYVSPPFRVTAAPQRVAVPFPAPYPVGKGVISVLGEGKDLMVWLTPGWSIPSLSGIATQNVYWIPKTKC
jgi:hypothetical protein